MAIPVQWDSFSIPVSLEFCNAHEEYEWRCGQETYRQNPVSELQWHLLTTLTRFLNFGSHSFDRGRLQYLAQLLSLLDPDRFTREKWTNAIGSDRKMAHFIATGYSTLEDCLYSVHTGPQRNVTMAGTVSYNAYPDGLIQLTMKGLQDLFDSAMPDLVGAYLHGSFASLDYVGYSDVDVLVILSAQAAKDPLRLLRLRDMVGKAHRICLCADTLQHHGLFALTELDLSMYMEAYLPLAVFREARAFRGKQALAFQMRDCRFEAARTFLAFSRRILQRSKAASSFSDAYNIKHFTSLVLLLPCVFLATRDIFCYKRDSFQLLTPWVTREAFACLDIASQVRTAWHWPGIFGQLERLLLRHTMLSERRVRECFSRTTDRLFARQYREHFDEAFQRSLDRLIVQLLAHVSTK